MVTKINRPSLVFVILFAVFAMLQGVLNTLANEPASNDVYLLVSNENYINSYSTDPFTMTAQGYAHYGLYQDFGKMLVISDRVLVEMNDDDPIFSKINQLGLPNLGTVSNQGHPYAGELNEFIQFYSISTENYGTVEIISGTGRIGTVRDANTGEVLYAGSFGPENTLLGLFYDEERELFISHNRGGFGVFDASGNLVPTSTLTNPVQISSIPASDHTIPGHIEKDGDLYILTHVSNILALDATDPLSPTVLWWGQPVGQHIGHFSVFTGGIATLDVFSPTKLIVYNHQGQKIDGILLDGYAKDVAAYDNTVAVCYDKQVELYQLINSQLSLVATTQLAKNCDSIWFGPSPVSAEPVQPPITNTVFSIYLPTVMK